VLWQQNVQVNLNKRNVNEAERSVASIYCVYPTETGRSILRYFVVVAASAIVIIIIIIIITTTISMQGIYNYVPETNHVSRVYSVASVLCLQFVLHVTLFRQ